MGKAQQLSVERPCLGLFAGGHRDLDVIDRFQHHVMLHIVTPGIPRIWYDNHFHRQHLKRIAGAAHALIADVNSLRKQKFLNELRTDRTRPCSTARLADPTQVSTAVVQYSFQPSIDELKAIQRDVR
jgi:hypothetical protein